MKLAEIHAAVEAYEAAQAQRKMGLAALEVMNR